MAAPNARLHPDVIAEARAAYRWYSERNPSAAIAFMTELDHAIDEIEKSPERWPVHLHGTRKLLLRRFPYGVIYRITEGDLQVIQSPTDAAVPGIGEPADFKASKSILKVCSVEFT